jgi:hypothetical protein
MTLAHIRKSITFRQLGVINDCITGKNSVKISSNEGNNN